MKKWKLKLKISSSSSAGGQRLDSTPHSVETPNQLLTAQQQDNVSDTGNLLTLYSFHISFFLNSDI